MGYLLTSGVEMHEKHPDTFWIPSQEMKDSVRPGDCVKLIFSDGEGGGERMWVKVSSIVMTRRGIEFLKGTLANIPYHLPLEVGDPIEFGPEYIIAIEEPRGSLGADSGDEDLDPVAAVVDSPR
jgi:hypothetical protein